MTDRERKLYQSYEDLAQQFKETIADEDKLNKQLRQLHADFLRCVDNKNPIH